MSSCSRWAYEVIRVIGPAMPTTELFAAATRLTETEAEFKVWSQAHNSKVGDDDVLFIGPSPPAIVNEAASANDADCFEEKIIAMLLGFWVSVLTFIRIISIMLRIRGNSGSRWKFAYKTEDKAVADQIPNGDALRKCILKGPYTPTIVTTPAVPTIEDSPAVPEQTSVETVMNMTSENRAHFKSKKEAIHLILTGIRDEIYSTVDACQTAQEMWEAIERLQQGESLNIQDVKTNLFWEFGQFTSHDGETIESYYTRFYKMMNEMIRNNLTVATMQVNVQFLQQLQPEWSRFVTIVKQQHKLDEVSYHKLFDILKQYQKEVNELRAERMAKNANPLALEFGHFAKECKKSKRVKDSTYHKEKMLLCKQAEKGVQLKAKQSDWLADTDEEIDEQELEAHYSYIAKIQEVPNVDSCTDSAPLE
ncbi:hypothetical protein Tco_1068717 [Tanacetum coccineum]|uniref:Gag-Pol polyprotein n=1 Tax=Tanacetum coccineum TaxID=301880 RepID=A0ABQ5HIC6_9ASTR